MTKKERQQIVARLKRGIKDSETQSFGYWDHGYRPYIDKDDILALLQTIKILKSENKRLQKQAISAAEFANDMNKYAMKLEEEGHQH